MALNISVLDAVEFVGHDGSDVVFPELAEPMCRRGFHQQEMIELALHLGVSPVPFQVLPSLRSECGQFSHAMYPHVTLRFEMFHEIIGSSKGVLEGACRKCHHAVAYEYGRIFDPDGREFNYSLKNCEAQGFYGKQLWIFN